MPPAFFLDKNQCCLKFFADKLFFFFVGFFSSITILQIVLVGILNKTVIFSVYLKLDDLYGYTTAFPISSIEKFGASNFNHLPDFLEEHVRSIVHNSFS